MVEPESYGDGSLTEVGGLVEYAVGKRSRAYDRTFGREPDLEID
jgi:hypothetical protein